MTEVVPSERTLCRRGGHRCRDLAPTPIDRIAGALVAVAHVEGPARGAGPRVLDALWRSATDYVAWEDQGGAPRSVAPAWMLAAVVVHPDAAYRVAEVEALAICSDLNPDAVGLCARYGELLAAALSESRHPVAAEPTAPAPGEPPALGDLDAVAAAVAAVEWALPQRATLPALLEVLDIAPDRRLAVRTAVAAAVGLRDGLSGLPSPFHRDLQLVARSVELARELVRTRRANEAQP